MKQKELHRFWLVVRTIQTFFYTLNSTVKAVKQHISVYVSDDVLFWLVPLKM